MRAFVEEFGLLVVDSQIDGMGEGEYSSSGFLNGWSKGNEFAYKAFLQRSGNEHLFTMPTSRMDECWRWNSARDDLQSKFGEAVFVPRFLFVNRHGTVLPTIVWPDGIPIAMPESEAILLQRKRILPKRFFRSVEDTALANWNEVEEAVSDFPLERGALPYRLLSYSTVPDSIVTCLRQPEPLDEKPVGVSVDKILNAELVEKYRTESN